MTIDRGFTLAQMSAEVREVNTAHGWRTGDNSPGDYVALLHSEISEALEAYRDYRLADASVNGKPMGVGSELADVLIRLLDMCDVFNVRLFDMDVKLADVEPVSRLTAEVPHQLETFGDFMSWLHRCANHLWEMDAEFDDAPTMLRALVTVAKRFDVDLTAEYHRKIAYDRTRPYQHGGRTLSDDGRTS